MKKKCPTDKVTAQSVADQMMKRLVLCTGLPALAVVSTELNCADRTQVNDNTINIKTNVMSY